LLHVPHSSNYIPSTFSKRGRLAQEDARKEIAEFSRDLIDYYTDELFAPLKNKDHILPIVFNCNRCICDVERLPKDPLDKVGCGFLYHFDESFYGECDFNVIEAVEMYNKHQEEIRQALRYTCSPDAIHRGHENTLIIDCHSFSSRPNLLCVNPPHDVDFCIGYNDDWSKPNDRLIRDVEIFLMQKGYKVSINYPFSNSKTVDTPLYYHSMMIEVNKSLYMNEDTLIKTGRFAKIQADLNELYEELLLTDYIPKHPSKADAMLGYCDKCDLKQ